MINKKIYKIDGVTYNSLDEMPIELRNSLDKDWNWEIDFVEDVKKNRNITQTIVTSEVKRYNNIEEAPDEIKEKIKHLKIQSSPWKYKRISLTQGAIFTWIIIIIFNILVFIDFDNVNLKYFLNYFNVTK